MQTAQSNAAFNRAMEALRAVGAGQETWSAVSRLACDVVGADAAAFIVWRSDGGTVDLMEGHGHDPALISDYDAHFYQHDVLVKFARFSNEWQVSDELYPESQWGAHEFFGFLKKHSVAQVCALTLRLDRDVTAGFSFHRQKRICTRAADFAEGRLRQFTEQTYSAFATREARLQGARSSLSEAMADKSAACFLSNALGKITPLSEGTALARLTARSDLLVDRREIRHADVASNARLQRLVRAAAGGTPGRLCLRGRRTTAFRIEAQPAPAAAKFGSTQKLALVRICALDSNTAPDEEDLRGIFGLTRTEARVLACLCRGSSVAECADTLGSTIPTVRTHIAHLMNKLDCNRQSQLVRIAMLAI